MRRACFAAVFLFSSILSSALTLSLDDAVERGIENNLDLKKNLIDLSTSEYSANRLWSELFPAITGNLGVSYSSGLFTGDGFTLDKDKAGFSAGLGLNLTLNAGIPYTMKNIRLAYQNRLLSYQDACNQLTVQITKSFFSLIAEHENHAVLADLYNLAQMQYDKDQAAFKNGIVGELALMQSHLALENARYNLNSALTVYSGRMSDFLAQLGIPLDTDVSLEGKIESVKVELDTDQLIQENLPRRPDIVSKRQEIERLENVRKQTAYSSKAPSLRLQADWTGKNFSPFSDSLGGSATVSIPIDPWIPGTGKNQTVRGAKAAVEKARLDLQSTEDLASAQIRSLAINLKNQWDSVEIARLGLTIAERNSELAQQGYRNGMVDTVALENAQNALGDARRKLLQAELVYFNIVLDVSAALNINWKDLLG